MTLDDDVAAHLDAEAQRKGVPEEEVVNEALRRGLEGKKRFEVRPFDMGRPKIDVTCTSAAMSVLDQPEDVYEKSQTCC